MGLPGGFPGSPITLFLCLILTPSNKHLPLHPPATVCFTCSPFGSYHHFLMTTPHAVTTSDIHHPLLHQLRFALPSPPHPLFQSQVFQHHLNTPHHFNLNLPLLFSMLSFFLSCYLFIYSSSKFLWFIKVFSCGEGEPPYRF
jgi:hypothetical protein